MHEREEFIKRSHDFIFDNRVFIENLIRSKLLSPQYLEIKKKIENEKIRLNQLASLKNFFNFETINELQQEIDKLNDSPLKNFLVNLRNEFNDTPEYFLGNGEFENLSIYNKFENIINAKLSYERSQQMIANKEIEINVIETQRRITLENDVLKSVDNEKNNNYFFGLSHNIDIDGNILNKQKISRTKKISLFKSQHLRPTRNLKYFNECVEPKISSFNMKCPDYTDDDDNYYYHVYKNEALAVQEYKKFTSEEREVINYSSRLDVNRSSKDFQMPYTKGDVDDIEFYIIIGVTNDSFVFPTVSSSITLYERKTKKSTSFVVSNIHVYKYRKIGTIILSFL